MRILFIEDDKMNRRVVSDMLGVAGAVMTEAEDGETGLELLDAGQFDVVLLDLRMPGMDGFEVTRHIRARPDAKARIAIIILTADAAPDLRGKLLAAGVDDVLFKPVAMEALFETIGHLLARDVQGGRLIG